MRHLLVMDVPDRSGGASPGVPGQTTGGGCCCIGRQMTEAFLMIWQNSDYINVTQLVRYNGITLPNKNVYQIVGQDLSLIKGM